MLPSDVGAEEGEEGDEGAGGGAGEVVADEATGVVVEGETDDQGDADDGDDEAAGGDEDAVAPAVAEVAAEEEGDDFDGAGGRAVEQGLLGRVTEGGDELGEEVGDAAVGDVGDQGVEEEGPCEGVEEGFADLVPLEVLVADACDISPRFVCIIKMGVGRSITHLAD
ncbi:hypothetical protein Tdes44962_MAKER08848 [Teratosphaeria destructans]|uniref:Uncharacterized protein n=1 Tax=Teratosphaeria destructans TaxID=418781 RepID=A0A9W7SV06_9PEZI|nr:hypothetical protein Tdes44962_MAKER08848 [Teratosphaeria destructans]